MALKLQQIENLEINLKEVKSNFGTMQQQSAVAMETASANFEREKKQLAVKLEGLQ